VTLPFIEDNDQVRARVQHLEELRELLGVTYPNSFRRSEVVRAGFEDTTTSVIEKFSSQLPAVSEGERPAPEVLEEANRRLNPFELRLSGRITTPPRTMGKAAFVHISDGVSRIQIYIRKDDVKGQRADGESVDGWRLFQLLDHGDYIGVEGFLFLTKTGELSIHVRELHFLTKALLPMPDKMHGITDPEIRQRQRYVDLLSGSLKIERTEGELTPREVFERRAKLIREIRGFLDQSGCIEVETPMLTPLATGAAARPFKTWHNTLNIPLFARIAPELYLKRLLVGGFERVYELNRNFRNEGLSTRHNPEFTMLEVYCAFMDARGMMEFCERLVAEALERVTGSLDLTYGNEKISFRAPWRRVSMKEAILEHWPEEHRTVNGERFNPSWLDDIQRLRMLVKIFAPKAEKGSGEAEETEKGHLIENLFGHVAEAHLRQPTFITEFPKSISPLAKAMSEDAHMADRFELYITGIEVANGFSELNDPQEQYARFEEQMKRREKGDEEAMQMDEDYLRALSYGMPPAAGIGIGIDRLTMIATNQRSIRDVILFPHMRPRRSEEEETIPVHQE
jgi:lysyl-tRNA synthetase, class II